MTVHILIKPLILIVGLLSTALAMAAPFVVNDVRIVGAERIGENNVRAYVPVKLGQTFDVDVQGAEVVRYMYQSGLFQDVQLRQQGNSLIVAVATRATIADVRVTGNEKIDSRVLEATLERIDVQPGRPFNRSILDTLQRELTQLYQSAGNYAASVDVNTQVLPRERVDVEIVISEGDVTEIRSIEIIGNVVFSDELLLAQMESGPTINPFSGKDDFNRAKLDADIERIRDYYRNRGYVGFEVVSTNVALTPARDGIAITINIREGGPFRIGRINLQSSGPVPQAELRQLFRVQEGGGYVHSDIVSARQAIIDRLGREGHAFAEVAVEPDVQENAQLVHLNVDVKPGRRTYIRYIEFRGNAETQDEVLRREFRQFEGSVFNPDAVRRSGERLQRLAYLDGADIKLNPVEGAPDQVDLLVDITEGRSGEFRISGGVSSDGFIFGGAFKRANIFGTGQTLDASIDVGSGTKSFRIQHLNPYFTDDGVSRTVYFNYKETDTSEAASSSADWISDVASVGASFGVPLDEHSTFAVGLGAERNVVTATAGTSQEVRDEITQYGDTFNYGRANVRYVRDTRDNIIFPNSGTKQEVSLEAAIPGSGLEYYKYGYNAEVYTPVSGDIVFAARGAVADGKGGGDRTTLPFFNRYYAGGISSVRGFAAGSLGPRDSNNDASGGDFRVTGSAALILPPWSEEYKKSMRFSAFVDTGNVYKDASSFDSGALRSSYGAGFIWLTPVGPLTFSVAKPLEEKDDDRTQLFQFSIGSVF